jgi:threonyl-tRNA synthetase
MQLHSLDANDRRAPGNRFDPFRQRQEDAGTASRPSDAVLRQVIVDHAQARLRATGCCERKTARRSSPATIQPLRCLELSPGAPSARVFCREDQVEAEIARRCRIQTALLHDFGFAPIEVRVPASAAGDIEFHLQDRLGRAWQCGGIRIARDADRPVILHHAVFGSLERFVGMLLEQHDGILPAWLAPVQVLVASINKEAAPYALKLERALHDAGLRIALDDGPDTLPRKVVEARQRGIPMIAVIGKREARERLVTLRHRDGRQEVLELDKVVGHIRAATAAPGR